jgi:hypothetical protein
MSQADVPESQIPTCGAFFLLMMVGMILAMAVSAFILLLSWLVTLIVPLLLWQAFAASALLFLATVVILTKLQPLASLEIILWILATTSIAIFTAVVLAWLTTLITPLTVWEALAPTGVITVAIVYYALHLFDEVLDSYESRQFAEEVEDQVRIARLTSFEKSMEPGSSGGKKRAKRSSQSGKRGEGA